MSDSKNLKWAEDFTDEASSGPAKETTVSPDVPAANDADGWQKYRNWISKAPAPRGRRVGIDPSLYSWKAYRNWTDQVKRSWRDDSSD